MMERLCEGCKKPLGPMDYLWSVCMDCTRARHRAVLRRKCVCRKADRRPKPITTRVRSWVSCERCLGTIPERGTRNG